MLVQINSNPDQYLVVPTDTPIVLHKIAEYLGTDDFTVMSHTVNSTVNRRDYKSDQRGNATIAFQAITEQKMNACIVTLN
jgi:hypothetical protein